MGETSLRVFFFAIEKYYKTCDRFARVKEIPGERDHFHSCCSTVFGHRHLQLDHQFTTWWSFSLFHSGFFNKLSIMPNSIIALCDWKWFVCMRARASSQIRTKRPFSLLLFVVFLLKWKFLFSYDFSNENFCCLFGWMDEILSSISKLAALACLREPEKLWMLMRLRKVGQILDVLLLLCRAQFSFNKVNDIFCHKVSNWNDSV